VPPGFYQAKYDYVDKRSTAALLSTTPENPTSKQLAISKTARSLSPDRDSMGSPGYKKGKFVGCNVLSQTLEVRELQMKFA